LEFQVSLDLGAWDLEFPGDTPGDTSKKVEKNVASL
jgi:hypothetical protein